MSELHLSKICLLNLCKFCLQNFGGVVFILVNRLKFVSMLFRVSLATTFQSNSGP